MTEEKLSQNIYSVVSETTKVSEKAVLKGDVNIGDYSNIEEAVIINARENQIIIGDQVRIQKGARIEAFGENKNTYICNQVNIGSYAKVHNATLEEGAIIGHRSVIMDSAFVSRNAKIGSNTIIVKNAIVPEGMICESDSIYAGIPARRIADVPVRGSELKEAEKAG